MSKKIFSDKEIKILQKNPNIQRVSSLAITYTDVYKNKFMDEYLTGKFPRHIFEENGFDVDIIGMKRIEQAAARWNRSYKRDGLIGLSDTRKIGSGRPLKRELTQTEIIERQEAKIKLLEGQVDLLKKLETTERRLLNAGQNLKSSTIFQLIYETIEQNEYKQLTKYFCELLGVSRSG
jgi:putative transposase